jgi:hypothetical protein
MPRRAKCRRTSTSLLGRAAKTRVSVLTAMTLASKAMRCGFKSCLSRHNTNTFAGRLLATQRSHKPSSRRFDSCPRDQ